MAKTKDKKGNAFAEALLFVWFLVGVIMLNVGVFIFLMGSLVNLLIFFGLFQILESLFAVIIVTDTLPDD